MKRFITMFTIVLLTFGFFSSPIYADKNKGSVFLDAGHGGIDSGAIGYGEKEKDWILETTLACKDELEKYGVKVFMSRETDIFVELSERSRMANNKGAICFVSIHYNASNGTYGLTIGADREDGSDKLCDSIAKHIKISRKDTNNPNVQTWKKYGYYSVLNRTKMPAVIVECAFIDNEEDRKVADTKEEREAMGKQIAHGILDYLGIDRDKKNTKQPSSKSETKKENNLIEERVKEKIYRINAEYIKKVILDK